MSEREREPLERHLQPAYDEARTASTWNRIAARRRSPGRSPRRWMLASACAAALAITVAVAAWPQASRPEPLTSRDPSVSVAPGTIWTSPAHDVVLDDESTIALAVDARLQVLANEGTRFSTLLEAGSAHFDVHPGGPRRWEIETALASVEVVGTAFTVSVRGRQLEVGVDRGVVLVHGELVPGRVVRLTAGQRIVVGPPAAPVAIAPIAPALPAPPPPPSAPDVRPRPALAPAHAPAPPPAAVSVADIVARADQLSAAGDPAGAASLLEGVRSRDGDLASGLVAFTLGRLYLEALGKPELAAAAFDEVITRGTPRSLLEDAYARRVEAWVRAGHRDQASTAFAAYEHAYPEGRRITALRALVEAP